MDCLALVLPSGDASDIKSLAELGYRHTDMTDDDVAQILRRNPRAIGYVVEAVGPKSIDVFFELLKSCLDHRRNSTTAGELLELAVPVIAAMVILAAAQNSGFGSPKSFRQVQWLLKAATALAVGDGRGKRERKSTQALQAPPCRTPEVFKYRIEPSVAAEMAAMDKDWSRVVLSGVVGLLTSAMSMMMGSSNSSDGSGGLGGSVLEKAVDAAALDLPYLVQCAALAPNPAIAACYRSLLESLVKSCPEQCTRVRAAVRQVAPMLCGAARGSLRSSAKEAVTVEKEVTASQVLELQAVILLGLLDHSADTGGLAEGVTTMLAGSIDRVCYIMGARRLLAAANACGTAEGNEEADDYEEDDSMTTLRDSAALRILKRCRKPVEAVVPGLTKASAESVLAAWFTKVAAEAAAVGKLAHLASLRDLLRTALLLCGLWELGGSLAVQQAFARAIAALVTQTSVVSECLGSGAADEALGSAAVDDRLRGVFDAFHLFGPGLVADWVPALLEQILPIVGPAAQEASLRVCALAVWNSHGSSTENLRAYRGELLRQFENPVRGLCENARQASASDAKLDHPRAYLNNSPAFFAALRRRENLQAAVAQAMALLGSRWFFANFWRLTPSSQATRNFATDFVCDTGLWLLEGLSSPHFSGGLDLEDAHQFLLPLIPWMRAERASTVDKLAAERIGGANAAEVKYLEALILLYDRVEPMLAGGLGAFLLRQPDATSLQALVHLLISPEVSTRADNAVLVADALRKLLLEDGPLAGVLWPSLIDWGHQVLVASAQSEKLAAAARNLLVVACNSVPDEEAQKLLSVLFVRVRAIAPWVGGGEATAIEAGEEERYALLTQLIGVVVETHPHALTPGVLDSLTSFTLSSMSSEVARSKAFSIQANMPQRAWHHLLAKILDASTSSLLNQRKFGSDRGGLTDVARVLSAVVAASELTDVTLWKTRMQVWESLLREVLTRFQLAHTIPTPGAVDTASLSGGLVADAVFIELLCHGVLAELSIKCSSLTSVTRRRARRSLDLLVPLFAAAAALPTLVDYLILGLTLTEFAEVQRGFANAATHILETSNLLAGELREALEQTLALTKPLCFNLDKTSRHSSRLGSRATRSTRFTTRTLRTRKSHYSRLR